MTNKQCIQTVTQKMASSILFCLLCKRSRGLAAHNRQVPIKDLFQKKLFLKTHSQSGL